MNQSRKATNPEIRIEQPPKLGIFQSILSRIGIIPPPAPAQVPSFTDHVRQQHAERSEDIPE